MATSEQQYATGRRKEAVARVWIQPGSGKMMINRRDAEKYFGRETLKMMIRAPFEVTETINQFDVQVNVVGGGLSGQAGAIRHGISRALCRNNPALRTALKRAGFMTRDARKVERKKYGRPGARKRFQFSKR